MVASEKVTKYRAAAGYSGAFRRIATATGWVAGLAIVFALTEAAPAGALTIAGLSEQHADGIGDPRLRRELSMTAGRLVVRWDVASADPAKVDGWLAAARSQRIRPLVVFNHTPEMRCPAAPCVAPSVAQFRDAFRAFRARWPTVREFAPWNEVNVRSQPLHDDPRRAARFYNVMVAACPGCTILGAELLDNTAAAAYVRRMTPVMRVKPKVWGVHNYEDINHFRTSGSDAILAATKGKIWLTEAAGLVRYVDGDANVIYPFDEEFAARATSYLFDYVEAHPDRISRVYYYAWRNRAPNDDSFDTALLRRDGSKRPSYDIVGARLAKLLPGIASAPPISKAGRRETRPLELLDRRLRIVRGGLMVGPLRCAPARGSRCSGRIELRWNGQRRAFALRRFALGARGTGTYRIRVGPRTLRRLARPASSGRVTLVLRLSRPSGLTRVHPRLPVILSRA